MKEVFAGTVLFLIFVILMSFFSWGMYAFFAPKMEATRREVFYNTPSYQLGKQQEMRKIQREAQNNPENAKILENVQNIQTPYSPQ